MIVLLAACAHTLPTASIEVDGHPVTVEVADDEATRQNGLMNRDHLGADAGMLFVYPDEQVRGFWMKDTRIPLSIAFATRSGHIVRIADMKPFDRTRVSSLAPATYALEMNRGWFAAHGVEEGDVIRGLPKPPESE